MPQMLWKNKKQDVDYINNMEQYKTSYINHDS